MKKSLRTKNEIFFCICVYGNKFTHSCAQYLDFEMAYTYLEGESGCALHELNILIVIFPLYCTEIRTAKFSWL